VSGNSEFLDEPPWTFTAASSVVLKATDAFSAGDRFNVFDFGALILTTSLVPTSTYSCGSDPEPCFVDPLISHGLRVLAPGPHAITIVPVISSHDAGAAYFRVDAIPEPALIVLLGTGLATGLVRRRRRESAASH
jgi:hypothetical protein